MTVSGGSATEENRHETHARSRLGREYCKARSASIRRCSPRSRSHQDATMRNGCSTTRELISQSQRAAGNPGLTISASRSESGDELKEVYARLHKRGGNIVEQGQTTCCYAKSEKSWIDDPAGISWETFHTTGESTDYGRRQRRTRGAESLMRSRVALRHECPGASRSVRLPGGLSRCHGRTVQRPVPLHRQFGPLDHGRSHPEQARRREFRAYSRRQPAERPGQSRTRMQLLQGSATTRRASARSRGASLPSPARRRSISCSPSATTPQAKPVRSGPASR